MAYIVTVAPTDQKKWVVVSTRSSSALFDTRSDAIQHARRLLAAAGGGVMRMQHTMEFDATALQAAAR